MKSTVPFVTSLIFLISAPQSTTSAIVNGGSFIHNALSYNPLRELNRRPNVHFNLLSSSKNSSGFRSPGSQTKEYLTISELQDDYQQTTSGTGMGGGGSVGGFSPSLTGSNLPSPQRFPYITKLPAQVVNANLMRRYSVSTILAGTLFYSLTILPLIMMLTSTGPFSVYGSMQPPGPPPMAMFGRRRRKRSLPPGYYSQRGAWKRFHQMPLLGFQTIRFLSLLEATLELRQINDENCKKLHLCNVYHQVMQQGAHTANIHTFEEALLEDFG